MQQIMAIDIIASNIATLVSWLIITVLSQKIMRFRAAAVRAPDGYIPGGGSRNPIPNHVWFWCN
jgi:hypothetical protein